MRLSTRSISRHPIFAGSTRCSLSIIFFFLLLFFCGNETPVSAGNFSFSLPTSRPVNHTPPYSFYNPSFAFLPRREEMSFGNNIPLGILAVLTLAERNPLLYFTDKEMFRSRFDFLSFYDQLRHPYLFLLNPAQSPREIVAHIDSSSLSFSDENGEPLIFDSFSGAAGFSQPYSPLLPPPLLSYSLRFGKFHSKSFLFFGSTGHSLEAGDQLQDVLQGADVSPSTEYEFAASLSLSGGIAQSASYVFRWGNEKRVLIFSPRVLAYYRAFSAEAGYKVLLKTGETVHSDDTSILHTVEGKERLFLAMPGKGWGAGGRLDIGGSYVYENFTAGLAFLNLYGIDRTTGRRISLGGTENKEVHFDYGFSPHSLFSSSYQIRWDEYTLLPQLDLAITENFSSHLSLSMFRGSFMSGVSFGYSDGWEGALRIGYRTRSPRTREETSSSGGGALRSYSETARSRGASRFRGASRRIAVKLSFHRSPFTHRNIFGVGLQGRWRK